MTALASAHLKWEPTLAFAPRWAEPKKSNVIKGPTGKFTAYLPPASNSTFTAYATAFMKRYKAGLPIERTAADALK